MASHSCPPCGMVVEEEAVNGVEVAAVILELVLEHRGGGEEGQVPRPVARSIGLGRLVNWTRPPGR